MLMLLAASLFSTASLSSVTYAYTAAARYDPDAWVRGSERFPEGARVFVSRNSKRLPLAPSLAWSADPVSSFDGRRILFSGKRSVRDPWQVWEVEIGGEPLALTRCTTDCIRPLYLPDEKIVYTRVDRDQSVLEVTGRGQYSPKKLTFAPDHYLTNDVLRDGRILFEAARWSAGGFHRALMTVYPDGTGVAALREDSGYDRHDARELASGEIVFQSADCIMQFKGSDLTESEVESKNSAFCSIRAPIADIEPNLWVVSRFGTPSDVYQSLFLKQVGRAGWRRLLSLPHENVLQPAIVGARAVPRLFPSGLQPAGETAQVLGLPISGQVTASWLRVYTMAGDRSTEILGAAKVYPDGSFFVDLPGDQPVRFELLDGERRPIGGEQNWIWLRKGERRWCVGCHAGPQQAPANELPLALHDGAPARLTEPTAQHI
jgi:Hydrazine synthase alpha subunit middle domain